MARSELFNRLELKIVTLPAASSHVFRFDWSVAVWSTKGSLSPCLVAVWRPPLAARDNIFVSVSCYFKPSIH